MGNPTEVVALFTTVLIFNAIPDTNHNANPILTLILDTVVNKALSSVG